VNDSEGVNRFRISAGGGDGSSATNTGIMGQARSCLRALDRDLQLDEQRASGLNRICRRLHILDSQARHRTWRAQGLLLALLIDLHQHYAGAYLRHPAR
jgi:hypothetical protein